MAMTIHQLKEMRLIDKDKFISDLKNAKRTIDAICDSRHRDDGFKHPMSDAVDTIIDLVEHREEVQIDD
jgi:hypothetical protein